MDLFSAKPEITTAPPLPPYSDADAALHDTIASFIHMTDKMEHILPPDLNLATIQQHSSSDELFTPAATPASTAPPSFNLSSSSLSTSPLPNTLAPTSYEAAQPDSSAVCIATINNALHAAISAQATAPLAQCQTPSCSPCTVRNLSPLNSVRKRKSTRKPKTYSKPVASRFCHICSRMPRKGQGSATCRRMREGYCRKIVCEQCVREQGWDYDAIAQNPNDWLCPHCADICPPRSQCHIYNRINARRKKVGQKRPNSVATALASSDALMRPYAHLLEPSAIQVIQPPPNFRLNLPPHYSQP